jgi:hypothetical protein
VVVAQQPDGWWRWRFEPASSGARALVSAEAYPERDEAVSSAEQAYPGVPTNTQEPVHRRPKLRTLLRRTATAGLVLVVVLAAARSGNRRHSGPTA